MALHEDIECRYSLASNRLVSLLAAVENPDNNASHTEYYLRKGKKPEEDSKIHQAYQDCMELQLQLNLARNAIERLETVLCTRDQIAASEGNAREADMSVTLRQASTDKLRVLCEYLLHTLLSMSLPTPSIPHVPLNVYVMFTPQLCEALFTHLCVNSTRRTQIHAGALLVRLCGNQAWWGDFLGSVLLQYFSSEEREIFPQDRVFVLLTALAQKSLTGASAGQVVESILTLLAKLLSPLLLQYQSYYPASTGKPTNGVEFCDLFCFVPEEKVVFLSFIY